ncbi:hypothetical protein [Paraburkholderia sp. RAU2J]|uniref:hypothetical protein n=1 Tax=Paraburkholderia sp. RAU2J TaxID=1938810 RepID=UPI001F5430F8|nr:hypothetical protein [Paraburkholderia sp. RAU2J]
MNRLYCLHGWRGPDTGACIAMLATPIHADRRTLGVLAVDCVNPDASRLFADDLHPVMIVATLTGQALLLQRSV